MSWKGFLRVDTNKVGLVDLVSRVEAVSVIPDGKVLIMTKAK